MEVRDILLYLFKKNSGNWDKIYEDLANKTYISETDVKSVKDKSLNDCEMFITIMDEIYPNSLKQVVKPPFVLFYEGDLTVLNHLFNDYTPSYIFLYGNNIFNIPEEKIIKFEDDGKLNIGGKLKIWENLEDYSRFRLPYGLTHNLVLTNHYSEKKGKLTKFNNILLPLFLSVNSNVFITPTAGPSYNNNLINEGASLIDSLNVLKEADIL